MGSNGGLATGTGGGPLGVLDRREEQVGGPLEVMDWREEQVGEPSAEVG